MEVLFSLVDVFFKYLLLIVYLGFLMVLVAAIIYPNSRSIVIQIHSSNTDKYSWTRYASSIVLLIALAVFCYERTFMMEVSQEVIWLIGLVFTGKVVQSGINKDK